MIQAMQQYVNQQIRALSYSIAGALTSTVASTQGGIASALYEMVANKTLYVYFYDVE